MEESPSVDLFRKPIRRMQEELEEATSKDSKVLYIQLNWKLEAQGEATSKTK